MTSNKIRKTEKDYFKLGKLVSSDKRASSYALETLTINKVRKARKIFEFYEDSEDFNDNLTINDIFRSFRKSKEKRLALS